MKKKILVIAGPTAVGKTKLSLKLAHRYNGEIISGDSMQVYRHLNIGTAKIMPKQMQGVTHHLINVRNIDQRYTAADFIANASAWIRKISGEGRLPIIVGGTGFYLKALLKNLPLGGKDTRHHPIRSRLKEWGDRHGQKALWQRLKRVDPQSARKIPFENERRVIRALEVYHQTGRPFSEQPNRESPFDSWILCLYTPRKLLYKRIDHRVDVMMKRGLLKEARWLFKRGGRALPAGKGIGYHEFYPYFQGKITLQRAIQLVQRDSRRYAKRQLTWFRNQMTVHWYDLIQHPQQIGSLNAQITKWLNS